MAKEIKLPGLGENIDSGTVVRMLVSKGELIEQDQSIMELETGKATVEVPSSVSGKITKILVKDGDSVNVGDVILNVDESSPKTSGDDSQAGGESEKEPEREEPTGEKGTAEKSDQGSEEDEPEGGEDAHAERFREPPAPSVKTSEDRLPVPASPSVRKFAREIGVDLAEVVGSGPDGRITTEDVKAYAKRMLTQPPAAASHGGAVKVPPLPDFEVWGEVERKPLSQVRKATARHMSLTWSVIPHVTQHDNADITGLERLRKRYSSKAERAGGKLTLTAMLLKITASALKVFPQFNASLDTNNDEIIQKMYYHVGVAVDTPKGLLVPVIRDVDKKNIIELSIELTETANKARKGKIKADEMKGGTFTISNLGGIGGTHFTPLVNHPEVAILGIGRGSYVPVYEDGEFEPRLILPLSLSYDHRVIDGADGARFLRWMAEAIQEPLLVAMEG